MSDENGAPSNIEKYLLLQIHNLRGNGSVKIIFCRRLVILTGEKKYKIARVKTCYLVNYVDLPYKIKIILYFTRQ